MKINKHDKQYTHYTSVREDITRGNNVSVRSDPVPCMADSPSLSTSIRGELFGNISNLQRQRVQRFPLYFAHGTSS